MVENLLGGRRYVTFLQSWEGGTSSDRTDFAAKCHSGTHTVKGITWCTYSKSLAIGKSYQSFLDMTDSQWNDLYTSYYVKSKWPIDGIQQLLDKYPLIGMQILETPWMMGPLGAEKLWADFMRKYFQYGKGNITPTQIVNFFLDKTTDYNTMLQMMYNWREAFYRGKSHYSGWMNRLNDLYFYFAPQSVYTLFGIFKAAKPISGL
jgi:hypothetical protein